LSLTLQRGEILKLVESIEERVIVALKESSGVSLLDASVAQDIFLDLLNDVQSLKKELFDD
jgi:hypothetical protein